MARTSSWLCSKMPKRRPSKRPWPARPRLRPASRISTCRGEGRDHRRAFGQLEYRGLKRGKNRIAAAKSACARGPAPLPPLPAPLPPHRPKPRQRPELGLKRPPRRSTALARRPRRPAPATIRSQLPRPCLPAQPLAPMRPRNRRPCPARPAAWPLGIQPRQFWFRSSFRNWLSHLCSGLNSTKRTARTRAAARRPHARGRSAFRSTRALWAYPRRHRVTARRGQREVLRQRPARGSPFERLAARTQEEPRTGRFGRRRAFGGGGIAGGSGRPRPVLYVLSARQRSPGHGIGE